MSTTNWTDVRKQAATARNAIAKQAVMKVPGFLKQHKIITSAQHAQLIATLDDGSLHKSGYDVLLDEPVNGARGVVAEVKSNNPYYPTRFGSGQKEHIVEDLDALTGVVPAKGGIRIDDFYKFLVLLDDGSGRVEDAADKLVKSYRRKIGQLGVKAADVVLWGTKALNNRDVFVVVL